MHAGKLDADMQQTLWDFLVIARRNNGIVQHHDAITGTAAQKVVDSFMEKARAGKAKIDE